MGEKNKQQAPLNDEIIVRKQDSIKQQMYIGPTLKKFAINNGQVFIGKHESIKKVCEKYKDIELLFIPIDDKLGIKIKNVNTPGTVENLIYEEIKKQIIGGENV